MNLALWQFVNLIMGTLALGVMIGVTATLLGITVSVNYSKKKNPNWPDDPPKE